jgi:hypothetical protein
MIATYASGAALLEGLHSFLTVGHTLAPSFTGTGTGYCDDAIGTAASVQETITATFTSGTTFTVAGSISGAMGTGTVGTLFTHARFRGTLTAGTAAWVSGDTITWTMTAPWAILNYTSGQSYIYQAPGNDGTRQVNAGWTVKSNSTGGYYGARIGAYPTWISTTFQWRPLNYCWWPLGVYSGSSCKLFVRASGQCVYAVARIGTYYMSMVAGLYDALGTWDQQPFPYIVGGCYSWMNEPADTSNSWLYSTINSPAFASVVKPQAPNASVGWSRGGATVYIRSPDNNWQPLDGANPQPTGATSYGIAHISRNFLSNAALAPCLDGSIPTWPYEILCEAQLQSTQVSGVSPVSCVVQGRQGYLPFARLIPGYDNASSLLVAESTFRVASTRANHVVLQTMNDSSADSLYALEMI